jgi:RimJ/RimL family protein N-acetyltransferase
MAQSLVQSASLVPGAGSSAGASLIVRAWTRRDRRAIEHWPAPTTPARWQEIEPTAGPRFSYAIELGGLLIGRITLRDFEEDTARLGIYLHPDHIGQGHGTAALKLFLARLWTPSIVRLDVAAGNRRAVRCYEKCGFVPVEERRAGYLEMEWRAWKSTP